VKKLSNKFFILMMWIVLVIIGVLQFFELPKALDYILLVLAISRILPIWCNIGKKIIQED